MKKISKEEKEELFCKEFIVDLNATAAYKRVHVKCKDSTARTESSRLLAKPNIVSRINELIKERSQRTELTADNVLKELYLIATADIAQAFEEDGSLKLIHDIPEKLRRAISGVETNELFDGVGKDKKQIGLIRKLKLWDKNKSLENLAKHFKLLTNVYEDNSKENLEKLSEEELDNKIKLMLGDILGVENMSEKEINRAIKVLLLSEEE